MRVLVSGASGMIGSCLVPQLVARGHEVITFGRNLPVGSGAAAHVSADLAGYSESAALPAGLDAVIHLGDGLKEFEGATTAYKRTLAARLLRGNQHLMRSALAAEIRHVIHVSSIKAVADEAAPVLLTESSPSVATTLYGVSKLALEQELTAMTAGTPARLIILRNPLTYGAGATGNIARVLRWLDGPWPFPHGGTEARRSLLAVGNLCDALIVVLESAKPGSGLFHLQDGAPLSVAEMMGALRRGLGRPERLWRPPRMLWTLARTIPSAAGIADRLAGSLVLSNRRFREHFPWHPRVQTFAGLEDAAQAYRQQQGH